MFKDPFFKDDIGPGSMDRRPADGDAGTLEPVRVLNREKIFSQKGRSIGQGVALQCKQQSWWTGTSYVAK